MSLKRLNRRKQDISALSSESNSLDTLFSPLPSKRRLMQSPTEHFGAVCARDNNDLNDDELRFRGFSYTYNTPGDVKSTLESFACPKCPAIFESRIGLTNHSKLHGARLPLCCDHCDFSCTNSKTLRHHRRAHGVMPRHRRQVSHKSAGIKKLKTCEMPMEEETIVIINPRQKIAAADGSAGGDYGGVEENFDNDGGPPPPMLTRATLNRAGLEEEEEDDDEEEACAAEQQLAKFVQQQQQYPSCSASRSATACGKKNKQKTTSSRLRTLATTSSSTAASNVIAAADFRRRKQPRGSVGSGNVCCDICPFTTPSRVRLQSHMDGHFRLTGFLCSVCAYKHESMGWLHLHCTLHLNKEGVPFQWPPVYVKEGQQAEEEQNVAGGVVVEEMARRERSTLRPLGGSVTNDDGEGRGG